MCPLADSGDARQRRADSAWRRDLLRRALQGTAAVPSGRVGVACVDRQGDAGDAPRPVGGQEQHRLGDLAFGEARAGAGGSSRAASRSGRMFMPASGCTTIVGVAIAAAWLTRSKSRNCPEPRSWSGPPAGEDSEGGQPRGLWCPPVTRSPAPFRRGHRGVPSTPCGRGDRDRRRLGQRRAEFLQPIAHAHGPTPTGCEPRRAVIVARAGPAFVAVHHRAPDPGRVDQLTCVSGHRDRHPPACDGQDPREMTVK